MTQHLMFDLVLRGICHGAIGQHHIEEALEPRLGIADNALAARERGNGRSPFIAMEIDDQIEMALAQLANKAQKSQEALVFAMLVDQDALIDILIAAHEITKRFIGKQGDMCLRIVRPQRPKCRRHQHEVTDMHRIDDQDILIHEKPFLLPDVL